MPNCFDANIQFGVHESFGNEGGGRNIPFGQKCNRPASNRRGLVVKQDRHITMPTRGMGAAEQIERIQNLTIIGAGKSLTQCSGNRHVQRPHLQSFWLNDLPLEGYSECMNIVPPHSQGDGEPDHQSYCCHNAQRWNRKRQARGKKQQQ